jgi:hypothetical protein
LNELLRLFRFCIDDDFSGGGVSWVVPSRNVVAEGDDSRFVLRLFDEAECVFGFELAEKVEA